MVYAKAKVENAQLVLQDQKIIDQSTLTSDCWTVQFNGLAACQSCEFKNTAGCGGGETLKRLKREHSDRYYDGSQNGCTC